MENERLIEKLRTAIEEVGRVKLELERQIDYANGVLRCLSEEEMCAGSPSAVRRAYEIDEEEEHVRKWLRSLRAHLTLIERRMVKLEDRLDAAKMEAARAKREAKLAKTAAAAGVRG